MAEFEWRGNPQRASLRHALRHRLRLDTPDIRVIAEVFLTSTTAVDLLAVGTMGELISIRIGLEKECEDSLLTRTLADLTWLRRHGPDLTRLAPDLGLGDSRPPRALVYCPHSSRDLALAIENLPPGLVELYRYRCLRQQGQLALWTEPLSPTRISDRGDTDGGGGRMGEGVPPRAAEVPTQASEPLPTTGAVASERLAKPSLSSSHAPTSPPSGFRTGLTEAQLRAPSQPREDMDRSEPDRS